MTAAYERRFNRISLLPISRFCGRAGALSERYGAGLAAAVSKAAHAHFAGRPEARELMARLSDDDQRMVENWERPSTITLQEGDDSVVLDYESAIKEFPVAINIWGDACQRDDPEVLTAGTLDFAWVRRCWNMKIAFIGDMKKTTYTTPNGTASLQLHGYARAYAKLTDCDAYVVGIWVLEDAQWQWQTSPPIRLDSPEADKIFETIAASALNISEEATTGPWCRECWGSEHCDEYLLPAVFASTELAPATQPGGITKENALQVLDAYERLSTLVGPLKKAIYHYIEHNGGISDPRDGKIFKQVWQQGREGAKLEAVRQLLEDMRATLGEEHPLVVKYGGIIRRGAKSPRHQWVNQ